MSELIPRKILFDNPRRASPHLSPDGQWLAYVAPDERDVLQVWLKPREGGLEELLTADPKRGIRSFFWTYLPDVLIYLQDKDGDENFHLYRVNVKSREVRSLTPFDGVRADVVAVEPQVPGQILISMNRRNPKVMDVHRVDLTSGESILVTQNPGNVIGWTTDSDLQVRAATAATPDGGHEIWWRAQEADAWSTILTLGPDDQGHPIDFSEDGKTLHLLSSHDANAQRLLAWDSGTKQFSVIAEDSEYDVAGVFVHPMHRTVLAVSFNKDRIRWQVIDPSIADDFKTLQNFRDGEIHPTHGDLQDHFWVVSFTSDVAPAQYYLYDRPAKKLIFLFSQRQGWEQLPLVPMQSVLIHSRDGLTLHAYLSQPPSRESVLPAVLLVHGGPWARDRWGLNAMVQWLVNRGYVVLQMNYRGSIGYGKKFLNAGNREWAAKMHDDLLDGVKWLIDNKRVDPKRIGIMGGSYGGYATLVGLTFTPDVFACGVDIVGPSNLMTLIKTIPSYWEPMKAAFARRVGPLDDEAFMASRSPLSRVDHIKKPLLIGQGANDPRVKQSESDQIVQAMRAKKLPVTYLVYTDEGHGFVRPENRMHFHARVEAFLAEHLGGRFESPLDPAGHCGEER